MPPINERVRELIDRYSRKSVTDFARRIGRDYLTIARLFKTDKRNGKYPEPSSGILIAILNMFNEVNPDWLILGNGEMLRKEESIICENCLKNEGRIEVMEKMIERLTKVVGT